MPSCIGIRREDKNQWERRIPLTPSHIKKLKKDRGITFVIQPSQIRAFSDQELHNAGAIIQEELTTCNVILAVKEIPNDFFEPEKTYVFFSHTIKGQEHNMLMLQQMMDLGCTLIDYERIVDRTGRRLVFFGRHAGLAGMVDSLWAFGQRLQWKHIDTPFNAVKQTIHYPTLPDIKHHFTTIRRQIETNGFPQAITPVVVGFAGYGNVSNGAQEILDLLPVKTIDPTRIETIYKNPSPHHIYKVVFKEEHMVKPVSRTASFQLQEYYQHPEKYESMFNQYLPHLSLLMNCIYWNVQYPRLVIKAYLKKSFPKPERLLVIGDISCDINGAIECTEKATTPDNPIFIYNPVTDTITDGSAGTGICIMAVDNLPCELPRESSTAFSDALAQFIPELVNADFSEPDFSKLVLPPEIKDAIILYQGKLTPNYSYINKYL